MLIKNIIFLFTLLIVSKNSFAHEYGFCWGEKDGFNICSKIMIKKENFPIVCQEFANDLGTGQYGYRSGSRKSRLKSLMKRQCDEILKEFRNSSSLDD